MTDPYTRTRRIRDALKFIRFMARERPALFERTKAARVGQTYGLDTDLVKRMKAKYRCELSFGEGK